MTAHTKLNKEGEKNEKEHFSADNFGSYTIFFNNCVSKGSGGYGMYSEI
jgi:hypothetical protein